MCLKYVCVLNTYVSKIRMCLKYVCARACMTHTEFASVFSLAFPLQRQFAPEQISAMVLENLKLSAETFREYDFDFTYVCLLVCVCDVCVIFCHGSGELEAQCRDFS
jgi:hypothetical protein